MFNITKSLFLIVAVAAIAGVGTYSSFSNSKKVLGTSDSKDMEYKTATVTVGDVTGFPMSFANMVPGGEYTSPNASIKYAGTTNGDLYFGATLVSGYDNLGDILQVAIEKVNPDNTSAGYVAGGWMNPADLYTGWVKLAENVSPNATLYYRVHVKVSDAAGNSLQGKTAYNGVIIHAVQAGHTAEGTPAAPVSNN